MQAMYGSDWKLVDNKGMMQDELGHRRRIDKVPCFLGGSLHSLRFLGQDVRHCVTMGVWACVYDGHEVCRSMKNRCRACGVHVAPTISYRMAVVNGLCDLCYGDAHAAFWATMNSKSVTTD